ncbi:hypothetical protein ACFPL7_04215 [Dongia soli]|uniref:Secreted protein n=1 Tax=Dongia soli TaxID=600628 RepID=A0ABU5EDQ7_9PROT|nr:hypothetical protein [Dongia soli]MDY0884503.1 hypothetical protein [Dongia soli]
MRPVMHALAATAAIISLGGLGLLTNAAGDDVRAKPDVTFNATDMTVSNTPPIAQAGANVDLSVSSDAVNVVGATTPITQPLTGESDLNGAPALAGQADASSPTTTEPTPPATSRTVNEAALKPMKAPDEPSGDALQYKPTESWSAQLNYRYMSVGGNDQVANACCAADGKGWKLDEQNAAAHIGFTYHFD